MPRLALWTMLLLPAGTALGQVELKWKWRGDDVFFVQTITKVSQTLLVEDPRGDTIKAPWPVRGASLVASLSGGTPLLSASALLPRNHERDREIQQNYEHVAWTRWTVTKRNEDGSAVVVMRSEPDRSRVVGKESEKPDTSLDGVELTLTLDAAGKVTGVEGADKLLAKLAGSDSDKREALDAALKPERIQASLAQGLGLLPGKKLMTGDVWTIPSDLKLGAMGEVKLERDCKLASVETRGAKSLARVTFNTRLIDYQPARSGPIAFRIEGGYLTTVSGRGSVEIDLDAGRPLSGQSNIKLTGWLTLRNSNVLYRARLTQEQSVKIKFDDKPPPKPVPMP